MRVLHVEAGQHLYGGALQVHYLTSGLTQQGVTSFLAAPRRAEIFDVIDEGVVPLPMTMSGDLDIGLVFRLIKAIRAHNIQLVHLHSRRGADLYGLIAAKLTKTPVIISRRVDNREPSWFARWKYHKCNKVITISEGIRKVLVDEGVNSEHVQTVLSAVDTNEYSPDPKVKSTNKDKTWFKNEFNTTDDDIVLAVLAQFIPRKGHQILFEALNELVKTKPDIRLLVFGKGPLEYELQQKCAELNLITRVSFCGFRDDLADILPHLDLVVHPAYAEGLGVSLLQANACGVPVIASKVGGIPEIIQHGKNGLLVEAGNVAELTESIAMLVGDQSIRAQMSSTGRQKVLADFSIDSMVLGNVSVYKQCVGIAP